MKKEGLFVILFLVLLCVPFISANIEDSFSEIQDYISQYDGGELTAPQLMVYISYARNKNNTSREVALSFLSNGVPVNPINTALGIMAFIIRWSLPLWVR